MRTFLSSRTVRFGFAAAAGMLAAVPVDAADLSRPSLKAPLVTVAPPLWGGFYLGAQGGAFYARDKVSTPNGELLEPLSIHDASYFAGGYAGYNYQTGALVVGVEGDVSAVLGGRAISPPAQTIVPSVLATGASDPKWLATAAARLGFAAGNFLIYAKGGGAWMRADYTATAQTDTGTVLGTETIGATRTGWLVGGGLEYAWTPNWLTKIEYNYLDFGSKDVTYTLAGVNAASFDSTAHVIKAGLAFKFGGWGVPGY